MNETSDAATIFAPLLRRWWLILIVGVLVGAGAYIYYNGKPTVYSANTQLYLGGSSEQQSVINNTLGKSNLSAAQVANQAALINSSIHETVHSQLLREHELVAARGKAKAKSSAGSDFVQITAEAHTAGAAALLANAYAQAYVNQHQSNYRAAVKAAILTTRRQLHRIEATEQQAAANASKGRGGSGRGANLAGVAALQAATLSAKISQLESDLSLSSVQQVAPAKPGTAKLVSPTPKKNAIFGFVIGIVLAAVAVYAMDRFERRLRSLADVEGIYHTQLLSALPRVKSPIVHGQDGPRPADALIEPLRRLHTSLALGDMLQGGEASPRLILFLSADADDGKSTLVADLALVQRDAGARVAVIEADLRAPEQASLLAANAPYGLTDVLAGAVSFDEAMRDAGGARSGVAIDGALADASVSTVAQSRRTGSLSVLPSGGEVANPPALLASPAMKDLLRSAAADFDYVLVDAPSLQVSDVMPLLRSVDGIVIVSRLEHTREASAQRLTELLSRSSTAPVLGVVANSVSRAGMRSYGFSSAYGERRRPRAS